MNRLEENNVLDDNLSSAYPKDVILVKLNTLEDALIPQPDKYPDGSKRIGLMWKHTKPMVGISFVIYVSKLSPTFITSTVTEIISETDETIIFKTQNSTYQLIIN